MSVSLFYQTVACAGKLAYETKYRALKVIRRQKNKKDMHPYRCRSCMQWHIGQSALRFEK